MSPGVVFDRIEMLSFDCYGTLIDWETGLLGAIAPLVARARVDVRDERILELYAAEEARAEAGPYMAYREVLRGTLLGMAHQLGIEIAPADEYLLAESLPGWRPFGDTVPALEALGRRFKLAILSNVDRALFAKTREHLGVRFDLVVTAEDVGNYKPARATFQALLDRSALAPDRLLHVAQSVYHDIVPAGSLGLATAWVRRPTGRGGSGATLPAAGRPDLEVDDLASLVRLCYSARGLGGQEPHVVRPEG